MSSPTSFLLPVNTKSGINSAHNAIQQNNQSIEHYNIRANHTISLLSNIIHYKCILHFTLSPTQN